MASATQEPTREERILEVLQLQYQWAADELSKWQLSLAENAAGAFEWSMPAFEAAAKMNLYQDVLGYLRRQDGVQPFESALNSILNNVSEEEHRHAKWPARSTSVPSNLMHQCRMVALAEMAEQLEGVLERYQAGK